MVRANSADVCRACGEAAPARSFLDVPSTDRPERFTILRCEACHVLRTDPVPPNLEPYYATDLAATMHRPGNPLFAALRRVQLGRELDRVLPHAIGAVLLDVGCGAGELAAVAHARGQSIVAADVQAPRGLPPGLPFVRFDFDTYAAEPLPLPGPYVAILRHVLEHVRDPQGCVRALGDLGAHAFYIVVPNAASREARWLGRWWYGWDPPRHLWHFDPPALRRLCEGVGLRVVGAGYDAAPNLLPSLYRWLRVHGWPPWSYRPFGPTTMATALSAPLDVLLGDGAMWVVATR